MNTLQKGGSLYENVNFEESEDEGDEENFPNTSELRKKFLFFRKYYSDLKFLRVRAIIEEEFNLTESKKNLVALLKSIFRIDNISVVTLYETDCELKTSFEGIDTSSQVWKSEVTRFSDHLDVSKPIEVTKQATKYPTMQPLLKRSASNFAVKVKGEKFDEPYTLIYLFHFDYQSMRILFEHQGLFSKIQEVILKFADLTVENNMRDVIINYEMHMETLRYYMECISDRLEILMIPRLISNLEETTKSQVIWINDAVNNENYKHIQKVLFLGLHPLNKMPYLLNYAANPDNMELNFEITSAWTLIRDWIYKERVALDLNSLNDKITGNYIFQFNKNSELVYLNDFDKNELDPFFTFPGVAKSRDELLLSKILKHRILHDTLQSIILGLVESGDRESSISKPNINIRIQVNEKGRLKGYCLIFRSSSIMNYKIKDPYADFEYALTPLALLRNEDVVDNSSNVERGGADSNSVSAFSGMKGYTKGMHPKKSGFGHNMGRQHHLDPKQRTPSPDVAPPTGPPQRRLQKQSSRFTIEGSLFSEGARSIQMPIPSHGKKKGYASCRQDFEEGPQTIYKQIEHKVNKSIVMEYMHGMSAPADLASDRSLGRQNEGSEPDDPAETSESFVKVLLEQKRKKYQGIYEHNKIKPSVEAIEDVKLNFDLNSWNFNALDQSVTYLMSTVNQIYERLEFFKDFSIQKQTFVSFLWQCHYYYTRNNNPFHNFFHGVTVCHAGYYFLVSSPILSSMMTQAIKLAFVTACLGHDLDHRGRNNVFEINSKSKLAIRYFDKSPLENHHAAILFSILKDSESDIFKSIPDEKLKDIKLNIIENILATDMKLHFPMLAEFKKKIAESPDIITPIDVLESTKVFTHCADLAGSCKEFTIASRWSHFVNREFIEQYEEEKKLGLAESAHFKNLTDPQGYLNSEIGFIDVILNPLYEAANEFLRRSLDEVMGHIRVTRETYAARLESIKQNPDSPYTISSGNKQDSTNYLPVSMTPRVVITEPKD